jgi:hypothetical protein
VQSHHQAKFLFKNIILRKLYPKSNIFSTSTREKVNVYLSLLPVHFQQGQLAIICSLYIIHLVLSFDHYTVNIEVEQKWMVAAFLQLNNNVQK